MSRIRGEAERASRDRTGTEEAYLSLEREVYGDVKALTAKLDEPLARLLDADAKLKQQEASLGS